MHSRIFVCCLSFLFSLLPGMRPLAAQSQPAEAPKAAEPAEHSAPPVVGGYEPVPITAEITKLGAAAVRLQSEKEAMPLVFSKVTLAEAQVVAGMNYRLKLELTSEKGKPQSAVAVMYRDLKGTKSLTSWEWLKK